MKYRHNKKRNTAFLFEAAVRELTRSIVEKDAVKKQKIVAILKEHFAKDSILNKEYELYKTLSCTQGLDSETAEKIIIEVKKAHDRLDPKQIFREQSKFIKAINYNLSKDVFNNFVPNYKNLATIYQMFDTELPIKKKVILEQKVKETLMSTAHEHKKENKVPTDSLVYNTFIKKYNDKYSGALLEEQKELINKYLTSYADNKLELKIYLNEEVGRIKSKIINFMDSNTITNESTINRFNGVLSVIESLREKEITPSLIETTAKIQKLVSEI